MNERKNFFNKTTQLDKLYNYASGLKLLSCKHDNFMFYGYFCRLNFNFVFHFNIVIMYNVKLHELNFTLNSENYKKKLNLSLLEDEEFSTPFCR